MNNSYISFEFINKCRMILSSEDFIEMSERRLKSQINSVVSEAVNNGIRLIRIAGPSGSGKTTSAKMVMRTIKELGLNAYYMSMDNWYKTFAVEDLPRTEDGDPDYESPELIDIEGFKSDMHDLLGGKEIRLREFDFTNRISYPGTKTIKCANDGIVVIEGLHAINPIFDIEEANLKVYVEPSDVKMDDGSMLTSSNIRLCRRMHRDIVDRGMSFEATIQKCRSVDIGQEKYIEPHTNDTRILRVDTLIFYELFIHKDELPDNQYLKQIPPTSFKKELIPSDSLLTEFYKR